MVATRCIRCARVLEGGGQYCDGCRPAEPVIARGAMSTVTSVPTCPKCGRGLDSGTMFCDCTLKVREDFEYGGFLIRLAAHLIDIVILAIIGAIFGFIIGDPTNAFFFNVLVGILYEVGFTASEGATPGKMAMGLRIVNLDGSDIALGQAILRVFGKWVSGLILGVGYLVMLFNDEKRCLHDYMANTVVILQRS